METGPGMVSARVTLPISVDPAVRTATSTKGWATERMAKQDAAFEAYTTLFKAGLVNDNLLPARQDIDEYDLGGHNIADKTSSLLQASPTFDPWPLIAQQQEENPRVYHQTLLTLRGAETKPIHMVLLTPTTMPTVSDLTLHWNQSTSFTIHSSHLPSTTLAYEGM